MHQDICLANINSHNNPANYHPLWEIFWSFYLLIYDSSHKDMRLITNKVCKHLCVIYLSENWKVLLVLMNYYIVGFQYKGKYALRE